MLSAGVVHAVQVGDEARPRWRRFEEGSQVSTQPGCESRTMLILSEFQIEFTLPGPTAMVALLHLHPCYCRAFVPAMNCSLNPSACLSPPTPLSALLTILIPSAIAALASWLPLDILGFPASTSSTPNHFPMSSTPVQSGCLLRIFPQRFCGFPVLRSRRIRRYRPQPVRIHQARMGTRCSYPRSGA
jgi:hypothetical protein